MEIKPAFQSSVDPTKVSLTITSVSRFVIFVLGYFMLAKGLDPTQATTAVQQVTEVLISAVPACFAVFYAGEAVYGIVRKFFVAKIA